MVTKARKDKRLFRRPVYPTNGERAMSPAPQGEAARHQAPPRVTLPARYGMIALGSGLLMLASAASIPLGPAATTAPRELLTFVSGVAALLLLLRASGAAPLSKAWSRCFLRWRWLVLSVTLILTVGMLVTFAGGATMVFTTTGAQSYATDIVSLAHEDAALALAGKNPYTSNAAYRDALARFSHALGTPVRGRVFGAGYDHPKPARIAAVQQRYGKDPATEAGAFAPDTLHSYPALSFLLYVPVLWAGIQNILILHLLIYWCLFAWLVWLTPAGWRHWGALVALAALPTVAASLILTNEVVVIGLVLTAWHFRRRRWLAPLLLGLACAYKQYAWFFAPFCAVELVMAHGWREALKRGLVALGAFLVPNLSYIITSPQAWFASLWLPMSEPLFATGMGIIALPIGHLVPYGWPFLYAVAEVAVMAALVWMYARRRSSVGDGALILALVPLFFAFRSLPSYFAFLPWLALYAANRHYARTVMPPASPVVQAWSVAANRLLQSLVPMHGSRSLAAGREGRERRPKLAIGLDRPSASLRLTMQGATCGAYTAACGALAGGVGSRCAREVEMAVQESVMRFVNETEALLAREGISESSLRQVGGRMAALAREPGLIPEAELAPMHDSDATATVLYSLGDDALTLLLAKFPATAATPTHDHNSWGVACVVAGRDRYMHWERVDDGSDPSHAQLRPLYERELSPGEYVVWLEPPHDIHSQQGIGGPAWELVLFGKNAMAFPRHYFDMQTGTVREAMPQ